jgi:hypothetical protein
VASTAIAAMATVAGYVALPDRESVVRSLDPPTGLALHSFRQALQRATGRLGRLAPGADRSGELAEGVDRDLMFDAGSTAIDEAFACYRDGGQLSDDELAWLCLLVQFADIHGVAWDRIDDRREGLKAHERLWTDALRRCDPNLAAPLGVLLAYVSWRSGEGLRASIAVQRALAADPACPDAHLMAAVLQQGLPPREPGRVRRRRRKARPHARRRHRR